jgi:hypothetical protein
VGCFGEDIFTFRKVRKNMQVRLLLTSRDWRAPSLVIRNSKGIALPYKIRFRFFRGIVFLAHEVRMQYAGYNLSNLKVTKIAIRDYFSFLSRDFSQAMRDLFFSFEITLEISDSKCYPISINANENGDSVWVSRSAINAGVFASKMIQRSSQFSFGVMIAIYSSEIVWNRDKNS